MNFIIRHEHVNNHCVSVYHNLSTDTYNTMLCLLNGDEHIIERSCDFAKKGSALKCYHDFLEEVKNEKI